MDRNIVRKCLEDYYCKVPHFDNINRYYHGNTDSLVNFHPMEGRSNLKVKTNFIKKLINEEAEYSFGNDVTYTALDDNEQIIKDIKYVLNNNKADHDINLGKELIKYGMVYEINYLDNDLRFRNKIVEPLNGYAYFEDDTLKYFIHVFEKQLDEKTYLDVYDEKYIYHLDMSLFEISPRTEHYFGIVPVGVGMLGNKAYNIDKGYEEGDNTIYNTIKTIQDAFETNLSDMVSEISDFRNSILKLYGVDFEVERDKDGNIKKDINGNPIKKPPVIRDNCILGFGNKQDQDAEWLIKNINDTFIKNTRDDLKDLIYTLTSHVDSNERMQSNLSGMALRARLQGLESKCKMNEKAMMNILKTRLICMFKYLYLTLSRDYDVNNIKIQFTPNIPIDESAIAQIITQIPHEVVSHETKRSWLPRIDNVISEGEKIKRENKEELPEVDLDKVMNNE